jgi:hypothetical protein
MGLSLEYEKVYDIIIRNRGYKGVYIGQKNARGKNFMDYLVIVNYLNKSKKKNYRLLSFKDFEFKDNKLHVIGRPSNIFIPINQESFYDGLLEEKLKKDYIRVFQKS